MRISDSLAESLLIKSGVCTEQQLDDLRSLSAKTHKPLQDLIITSGLLSETDLTRLYAEELQLPFVELSMDTINHRAMAHLPEHVAMRYNAFVFDIDDNDGTILVAMEDPSNTEATSFLEKQLGNNLKLHVTSSSLLKAALDHYHSSSRPNHILNILGYPSTPSGNAAIGDNVVEGSAAADSVNRILERALRVGASDVHIEPHLDHIVIRYRVDGLLRAVNKLPASALDPLLVHIKTTSQLKTEEHHAPQYGEWAVTMGDQHYKVRTSILSTIAGEKAVLHIVYESSQAPSLRDLGLWGTALRDLTKAMTEPHGSLFITGPVGSGKSTTLFSLLSALNSPSVNIATIEDPVEYRIAGANQFHINPESGTTFTTALKAVLHQDPNIIMLSEIHDGRTAKAVLQASLKGHLLLSALHTPSAAAGVHRLLDMNSKPYIVASSLQAMVGQRLARKLCPGCREAITPNKAMFEQIEKSTQLKSSGGFRRLHDLEGQALEEGIGGLNAGKTDTSLRELSTTARTINRLWRAREGGCGHCDNTGYRGRIGIFEVLMPSAAVQKTITKEGSVHAINQAAIESGMINMQLDGLIKALRGQTTLDEVLRVTAHG
jgi:type IV pilus assembly protein PilB